MRAFWFTFAGCAAAAIGVLVIVIVLGKEEFLYEKSPLWWATSVVSLIISVASFVIGFRLI